MDHGPFSLKVSVQSEPLIGNQGPRHGIESSFEKLF